MRIPLPPEADPLAGVAVSIWKKFFSNLWKRIGEEFLDDWRQELAAIALEASRLGYRYGDGRLPSFIYQRWYRFLINIGFKKTRHNGWKSDTPVSGYGDDFLEKIRDFFKETSSPPERKTAKTRGFKYNQMYFFTGHFVKRWQERIPLQFSPRAVLQQIALGETIFRQILKGNIVKERIRCPWFTVVLLRKDNGEVVFLTIFRQTKGEKNDCS